MKSPGVAQTSQYGGNSAGNSPAHRSQITLPPLPHPTHSGGYSASNRPRPACSASLCSLGASRFTKAIVRYYLISCQRRMISASRGNASGGKASDAKNPTSRHSGPASSVPPVSVAA